LTDDGQGQIVICPHRRAKTEDGILTPPHRQGMATARDIPSIEQLRQRSGVGALVVRYGHAAVVDALRAAAADARAQLAAGRELDAGDLGARIETDAAARLTSQLQPSLRRVVNATGVIVHTNLGRAPLPAPALERIRAVASGYANLEYDLAAGRRGTRDTHAEALLCRLTGAEAALVVNNCAAAALLALAALARGREVLVSRSELVEIGGGFRVPDVMAQSGARLREVGTTNRTRVGDYALAVGERTALILRVHPSNFRIEGFVERPSLGDIVALGRRLGVPVMEDLGSGFVVPGATGALAAEPTVQASLEAGVDVVAASGDKLLGGPQAGLLLGRRQLLATMRTHPLLRALRVDKLTYAALEATLLEHLSGRAEQSVPVLRMAALGASTIGSRAERLAVALRGAGWEADVIDGVSAIGGGSAPGTTVATRLLSITRQPLSADALEAWLRTLDPPIIARILDDRVVLDLRTVEEGDDAWIEEAIATRRGLGG
jgi:L-seryl-tRNA(Ser) seleniumtransferase